MLAYASGWWDIKYFALGNDLVNELSRSADVEHVDLTRELLGAGGKESRFGRDKRASVRGADRIRGGLSGIAIQPARQIDGHDRFAGCVDPRDRLIVRGPWLSRGAGPQECVDDPFGGRKLVVQSRGVESICDDLDWNAALLENLVILGRVTDESGRIGEKKYLDCHASQVEVPGGYEPVTPIIPLATANDD